MKRERERGRGTNNLALWILLCNLGGLSSKLQGWAK